MDQESIEINNSDKIVNIEQIWDKIGPLVETVCGKIFESVNVILKAHSNYGFREIEKNINPSIDDTLRIMSIAEFALGTFSTAQDDYSLNRQIHNALQMIWCVKGLVISLKSGNEADYEQMIEKMRLQAQH